MYLSRIKLSKVYRILKFKYFDWLKTYIDFNTDKRKNAANSFGKDFFKLLNNSVYGKTIENLRKLINIRLIISAKDYKKYESKESFVSQKYLVNSVAIQDTKLILTLYKPI